MTKVIQKNDAELIMLLTKKDPKAILFLYDKYAAALFGTIVREVIDKKFAEVILHQSFLYFWNNSSVNVTEGKHLLLWMINISKKITLATLADIACNKTDCGDRIIA